MYEIDNKDPKAKIKNLEYMLDSQKYNIKKKITKGIRNIYEVCFKNKVFFFFCKVIGGYKDEN